MREILSQSGRLLKARPAILLPVIVAGISSRLLFDGGPPLPSIVAFCLLDIALTSGMLAMIRAAHMREADGAWDAFFVGVGRHFAPLLGGSLVFVALALGTLLPLLILLLNTVGLFDVKVAVAKGTLSATEAEIALKWGMAIAGWGFIWGTVGFFLAVWKQAVVAQSLPWPKAWQASAAFVKHNWLEVSILLTLQMAGFAICLVAIGTAKVVLLAELAATVLLVINTYFTVAITVAFMGSPPNGEVVDAAA